MRKQRSAWNKGRLLGQKPPLKPKEIWSLRIRLQLADKARDLALFNLAVDSKLRGCDLVSLRVRDVYQGFAVSSRAIGTSIQPDREGLGPLHRSGSKPVRDTLAASDEGDADLQTDQEYPCNPAPPGAHEAGKHGQVSRDRGGRRPRDLGANGNLGRFRPKAVIRASCTMQKWLPCRSVLAV